MNQTNALIISDSNIRLEGFEAVTNKATVCFYPDRIVIMPKYPEEKLDCHYCITLDNNKEVQDEALVSRLREKGLRNHTQFFYHDGTYFDISDL